jgi:hypothetical protein
MGTFVTGHETVTAFEPARLALGPDAELAGVSGETLSEHTARLDATDVFPDLKQDTPTQAASLAAALRLVADLMDDLVTVDPDIPVSVSVAHHSVERRPVAGFLTHGQDGQCLTSLDLCAWLFDVPLTVSDPHPVLDGGVWVGGTVVRAGVRLTVQTPLRDPGVIADARRWFPAGTGGW